MSIKKDIVIRVGVVYVAFLLLVLMIISRIIVIQFVQGAKYREKAKAISLKDVVIEPSRGDILSCDGRILATSIPKYEIRMDMRAKGLENEIFMEKVDALSGCLSRLFNDKSRPAYRLELMQAYREGRRFFLIRRRVDFNQLKELKTFPLFNLGQNNSGLIAIQENVRVQPHMGLASRTIGYVSKSEEGNEVGLEGGLDTYLHGKEGISLMQRLSGGVWMPISSENEKEPEDGKDVVSTIDVNLQDVAESALRKQLETHNAHHGCVILMEVKTGEIKAIANFERDENGAYHEKYNYAIGEATEPGSTFKLASMIAALEDGYVHLTDTVDTHDGTITYHGKVMKDSHEGGFGIISLKKAFALSSNVGISSIIDKYYNKRPAQFVDRLYGMRLNKKLDLDIRGEGMPEISYPGDRHWSLISLQWMSIGYGIKLAPIHILTLYNAIANNGKMVKPRFVKSIMFHGKKYKDFDTEVLQSSICSGSTLKKIREMLEEVVESGTASNLKNPYYRIAGKTGTAQIAKKNQGYKAEGVSYQASFAGYFPAEDPKYSCIVVINSPSNSVYYGNLVAGPVFKEIADKVYATSLDMHPLLKPGSTLVDLPYSKTGCRKDLDYILDKLDIPLENDGKTEWVSTTKEDSKIKYKNLAVIKNLVPNVVDMGLRDALFLLENAGLKVLVRGKGKVVRQSISPGTNIRPGESIVLEMSKG